MNFEDLKGMTLTDIVANKHDDVVIMITDCGRKFMMYHEQDCCEDVTLEDVCGDLEDIKFSPILLAEEVCSSDEPHGQEYAPESYTWTFYKLATIKGTVTFRWFGQSNGYYSESVSFLDVAA